MGRLSFQIDLTQQYCNLKLTLSQEKVLFTKQKHLPFTLLSDSNVTVLQISFKDCKNAIIAFLHLKICFSSDFKGSFKRQVTLALHKADTSLGPKTGVDPEDVHFKESWLYFLADTTGNLTGPFIMPRGFLLHWKRQLKQNQSRYVDYIMQTSDSFWLALPLFQSCNLLCRAVHAFFTIT